MPLDQLEVKREQFRVELELLQERRAMRPHRPYHYTLKDFAGDRASVLASIRTAREPDAPKAGQDAFCWFHHEKLLLSFFFGDFKAAVHHSTRRREMGAHPFSSIEEASGLLFEGLAHLTEAGRLEKGRRSALAVARRCKKMLDRFARAAPDYCLGKALLLKAELSKRSKNYHDVTTIYRTAIGTLRTGGVAMEEIIAHELMASYLASKNKAEESKGALEKAIKVCKQWGAKGKAVMLEAKLIS